MAKTLAIILGIIIVLVGVLGFIANPIVGTTGMFVTNTALDVLYIVLGLVLLVIAFAMSAQAGMWLKVVGVVYLLAAVLGFVMASDGMVLGMFMVNTMTNVLHLVLGIVLLAAGFAGKGGAMAAPAMPSAPSMPSGPSTGGTM